uniref:Uncharacterized protein n=1 Tax=Arundo donax TaxID=35708 RepID=A0A0A9C8G0_ARUDO
MRRHCLLNKQYQRKKCGKKELRNQIGFEFSSHSTYFSPTICGTA